MLLGESVRDITDFGASQIPSLEALCPDIWTERRTKMRYPIELQVRYHTLARRHPIEEGIGRTLNMSSSGIFICSQNQINPGAKVEISIQWPFQLDRGIHLQLVGTGKVVRCDKLTLALAFDRYEFRTLKHWPESSAEQKVLASRAK
jgi:hypothetical protein